MHEVLLDTSTDGRPPRERSCSAWRENTQANHKTSNSKNITIERPRQTRGQNKTHQPSMPALPSLSLLWLAANLPSPSRAGEFAPVLTSSEFMRHPPSPTHALPSGIRRPALLAVYRSHIADGEGLDEFSVDDFFVWRGDRDHIEGGVQAVLSRVVQNLVSQTQRGEGEG